MKFIFRYIFRPFLIMLIILVGMLVVFYLMAPIYQFDDPQPFYGEKLYNPYEKMDSTHWRQYNFQVQSKAWGGITDGRKNTNELIDSMYKELNFDHVATSDYQKINLHGSEKPSFIPTYEHGYNAFKTHQVCIGAEKVLWVDLILFQTLSMKQWIIDQLSKDCEIVVVAHPLLRHGYSIEEMKYLTNYRIMEVLNNLRISLEHWDAALSSGHMIWVMGNDDAHDVMHYNEVGRKFTMINSPTTNREDIVKSLKSGNAYGVDFYPKMDVPLPERMIRIKNVPIIKRVELIGDTLFVESNQMAGAINFVGQNGVLQKTLIDTKTAYYKIKPEDPYIRTEFKYNDGSTIYLNPIIRYDGETPSTIVTASVNQSATLWLRIAYFVVILSLVYFFRRKKLNKA